MERIHDRLTFVMKGNKENPGEAEQKDQTIQNQERRKTRRWILSIRLIKPENLRERDKWNGAITGIKEGGKGKGHQGKISLLRGSEMLHKEIESSDSEEEEQRVGSSILGETDVVGHESKGNRARKCDGRRELSCKKIDHGDGESSEYQWDDAEILFGFFERVEEVGKYEKEGRMQKGGIFFIEFYLVLKIIS